MDTSLPKRIHLIGFDARHEEGVAAGTITPGNLISLDSTGKYVRHPEAGGACEKTFAVEDALQGRSIETDYASTEVVSLVIAKPGDVVYAWLAEGEACDPSDKLTSNGDGTLKVATSTDYRLAVPLESLDLSDSDTDTDTRIRVRIL